VVTLCSAGTFLLFLSRSCEELWRVEIGEWRPSNITSEELWRVAPFKHTLRGAEEGVLGGGV
jgi:hypothetical protein